MEKGVYKVTITCEYILKVPSSSPKQAENMAKYWIAQKKIPAKNVKIVKVEGQSQACLTLARANFLTIYKKFPNFQT